MGMVKGFAVGPCSAGEFTAESRVEIDFIACFLMLINDDCIDPGSRYSDFSGRESAFL